MTRKEREEVELVHTRCILELFDVMWHMEK